MLVALAIVAALPAVVLAQEGGDTVSRGNTQNGENIRRLRAAATPLTVTATARAATKRRHPRA
jgi:hypothetical protein